MTEYENMISEIKEIIDDGDIELDVVYVRWLLDRLAEKDARIAELKAQYEHLFHSVNSSQDAAYSAGHKDGRKLSRKKHES